MRSGRTQGDDIACRRGVSIPRISLPAIAPQFRLRLERSNAACLSATPVAFPWAGLRPANLQFQITDTSRMGRFQFRDCAFQIFCVSGGTPPGPNSDYHAGEDHHAACGHRKLGGDPEKFAELCKELHCVSLEPTGLIDGSCGKTAGSQSGKPRYGKRPCLRRDPGTARRTGPLDRDNAL